VSPHPYQLAAVIRAFQFRLWVAAGTAEHGGVPCGMLWSSDRMPRPAPDSSDCWPA